MGVGCLTGGGRGGDGIGECGRCDDAIGSGEGEWCSDLIGDGEGGPGGDDSSGTTTVVRWDGAGVDGGCPTRLLS